MADSFEVWTVLPASPAEIFKAWLDERAHAAFTGAAATSEPVVGGRFTAWDGYIVGTNRTLDPGRRIVQAWRTSEFAAGDDDSIIEVLLTREGKGTRVTLRHSNIPTGQGVRYESGWRTHYFEPMAKYFDKPKKKPALKKKTAKRVVAKKKKPVAKKAKPAPKRKPKKKPARRR